MVLEFQHFRVSSHVEAGGGHACVGRGSRTRYAGRRRRAAARARAEGAARAHRSLAR